MLSQQLIENALALCGKKMDDMKETYIFGNTIIKERFSIEKFGWYLISPEFIEEYPKHIYTKYGKGWASDGYALIHQINILINQYQKGNEKPLIELLSKIKTYDSK